MKKIIITISATAILGFSTVVGSASAETVSNLETKHEEVKNERSTVKANLTDAEKQVTDVLYELNDLNAKIKRTNEALELNHSTLSNVKEEIKENAKQVEKLEDSIAELEIKIEDRFDLLKDRLVAYQKSGGNIAFLDVLAGAQSFDDFITRSKAIKSISDSDIKLMEDLESDQIQVEKEKKSIDKKLKANKEKETELEGIADTIKEQKTEQENDKVALEKKQTKLTELKDSLQMKDSQLATLESQVQADIASAEATLVAETASVSSNEADSSSNSSDSNSSTDRESSNRNSTSSNNSNSSSNNSATSSNNSNTSSNSNSNNSTPAKKTKTVKKSTPKQTSAPSQRGGLGAAISAGNKYIGNSSYVLGAGRSASDQKAGRFDCSGFVSYAYGQAGISVPASTSGLSSVGKKISYSEIKPGDMVFFNTYKTNGHVGIYVGGGQFIGSQSGRGVSYASMNNVYWSAHFSGHVRRIQ